jgi:AcrR family transcriptional regulator
MPKIVDHFERQMQIVQIIIKVIAEHGLNGATVRTISREGGFSSGVIAHYFANKDEMIRFAFDAVADTIFRRIDARLRQAKGPERVRVILEEHIPLGRRDEEAAVAVAFWEMALHDRELKGQFHVKYARWRDYLRRELRPLFPQLAPERIDGRVDLAVAAADGLLITFAIEGKRYPPAQRREIVDELMALLGLPEIEAAVA